MESQDFSLDVPLKSADGIPRRLLCVGDFSTGSRPGATVKAKEHLATLVPRLQELGLGSDPTFFLETLSIALNDYLLGFKEPGQVSPARCTAVFAIVEGDRCHYLSVGDARLAVVRNGIILLPLGTDWYAPDRLAAHGDGTERRLSAAATPAFLGAEYAEGPLSRVRSLSLLPGDVLLLYSDGLESAPPAERVEAVLRSPNDPKRIAEALVAAATEDDDVTVTVVVGPYHPPESPGLKAINESVSALSARVTGLQSLVGNEEQGLKPQIGALTTGNTNLTRQVASLHALVDRLVEAVNGPQGIIPQFEEHRKQVKASLDEMDKRERETLDKLNQEKQARVAFELGIDPLRQDVASLMNEMSRPGGGATPEAIQPAPSSELCELAERLDQRLAEIASSLQALVQRPGGGTLQAADAGDTAGKAAAASGDTAGETAAASSGTGEVPRGPRIRSSGWDRPRQWWEELLGEGMRGLVAVVLTLLLVAAIFFGLYTALSRPAANAVLSEDTVQTAERGAQPSEDGRQEDNESAADEDPDTAGAGSNPGPLGSSTDQGQ